MPKKKARKTSKNPSKTTWGKGSKTRKPSRSPKQNPEFAIDAEENLARKGHVPRWSWPQVSSTLLATGSVKATADILSAKPATLYSWLSQGQYRNEWRKIRALWKREREAEKSRIREEKRIQNDKSWFPPGLHKEHKEAIRLLAEGRPEEALALLADVGDPD